MRNDTFSCMLSHQEGGKPKSILFLMGGVLLLSIKLEKISYYQIVIMYDGCE